MKINYQIKRSSKRKSITVKIESYTGKVTVLAPSTTPLSRIEGLVNERAEWIREKINAVKQSNSILPKIENGASIYIAGKNYLLNIADVKRASVKGDVITLPIANPKSSLINLTKRIFLPYVQAKTQYFAQRCGFKYKSVALNKAKRKWGSCTSNGEITYSTALAFLAEEICDYVVLHELCHTIEMNHQAGFYAILARLMPDYKFRQRLLKSFSSYLSYFYED